MAYSSITKPGDYFNTKLYTGNGSTQSITGVGFQPDWCWLKNRSATQHHQLFDAVRGATKRIYSSSTAAEDTASDTLTAFDSDGFSVGANGGINGNGNNIVSWNWLANGSGSANTDGTINSTVSVNTTAGFSVVSYTGTGSAGTIGHGLGATPSMIILKKRSGSANWMIWHQSLNLTDFQFMEFNGNAQQSSGTAVWDVSEINSTNIGIGTNSDSNGSSATYIAYCFADKKGFSKFGTYTSNNNADGPFVYTGFKPAFLMIKNKTTGNTGWEMYDNERPGYNINNKYLRANTNEAEVSSDRLDLLSNGFKLRQVGDTNYNSDVMIYMAFAENPLVANVNGGLPATAR